MENLLAVEVKPANADVQGVVNDLKTLTYFRRGLDAGENYFAAYSLIYGITEAEWTDLIHRVFRSAEHLRHQAAIDLNLVLPAIHTATGEAARFLAWPAH